MPPFDSNTIHRRTLLCSIGGAVALTGTATGAQAYSPLGHVTVEGAKEAVVGDNNTVYVAATDGFAIVDVSDPTAPSVIAERRDILAEEEEGPLRSIADVKVDGDRLLVAGPVYPESWESYFAAIVIYDVSDPTDPEFLRWRKTEMFHHNVFILDGVAYLTGNGVRGHPLVMVDVETLKELGRWSPTEGTPAWNRLQSTLWQLHDVWVQDGVAYPAYWDAGTWMVDVSDPAHPTPITKVRGRPPSAFTDLTDEEIRTTYLEPPGNDHSVTTNDDATLLGIGTESWDIPPKDTQAGPGGIELFDISRPTQPKSRSHIEPPSISDPFREGLWTTAHNFEIVGDRLYSSWYAGGVRLFDVSDPAAPTELRAWQNPKTASFWTAQAVRPGEFFIASSASNPGKGEDERLYTLPEPPLRETPNGSNSSETTTVSTSTRTTTPDRTTVRQTPSTTNGRTPNATLSENASGTGTEASGPGFSLTGAIVALSLGSWRYLRDRDRNRE